MSIYNLQQLNMCVLIVDCEHIGVFFIKLRIWHASSISLPTHVASEAIDFSAKFKEWTMQGVQNTFKINKEIINESKL